MINHNFIQINSDRVLPTEVYSSSTLAGQKLSIAAPGPAGLVNNNNTNVNNNGGMATAVNSSGAQIPSVFLGRTNEFAKFAGEYSPNPISLSLSCPPRLSLPLPI